MRKTPQPIFTRGGKAVEFFGEKKAMACLDGWGMPWYNEHEKRALPIDGSLPFVS